MDIDVVILSKTSTEKLFDILRETVTSLHNSETDFKFNVIIVESNKKIKEMFGNRLYEVKAKFVIPPLLDFNYNLFLNIGLRESKSNFILISNNDVIYFKDWFTEIKKQFDKDSKLLSASPTDMRWERHSLEHFDGKEQIYIGNRVSKEFTGWSFVLKRSVFDKIGSFDEKFDFYYQDDDWVQLYKMFNIKHGLVYNSKVRHLLSQSLEVVEKGDSLISMNKQHVKYKAKWDNLRGNKMYKRLSILICTINGRENYLERLTQRLKDQVTPEVEVLVAKDNREEKVGKKRNNLIHQAVGEYIVFIDDDDWVCENYVSRILKATDSKPDVVGFNSIITFNGVDSRRVEISLKHRNWSHKTGELDGKQQPVIYYRCPNHLTPIKASIARQIMFPELNDQEDRFFSLAIPSFANTEVYIDDYMYFYDCRNPKRYEVPLESLLEELKSEKEIVERAKRTAIL